MYESPSLHLEIVRQRHQELISKAETHRLATKAKAARAEDDGSDSLLAVRGAFAGILAAVSNFAHRGRTVPQHPSLNPV